MARGPSPSAVSDGVGGATPAVDDLRAGDSVIDAKQLRHRYGDLEVLKDVSFQVQRNEFVAVVGPSGCGKTTLFRLLIGLEQATSGEIVINGGRVTERDGSSGTAAVFQDHNLFPWRTAVSNVAFALEAQHVRGRAARRTRARDALARVHLDGFSDYYPHQLSGGMQQRVGIARAWAVDPEILLMDEPFGALDSQTRVLLQDQLVEIWESDKKTVLFVTHDIEEAVFLSDRVIVMHARPGGISAIIPIALQRPRRESVRLSPELLEYRREIVSLLHATERSSNGSVSRP